MDDELIRRQQRWRDAEHDGRDDDADAACRALFASAMPEPVASADFTARTLAAIANATVADARRARLTRRATIGGAGLAATLAIYFGGTWILWGASALLVGFIQLVVAVTVRFANGMDAGLNVWSLLSSLGRAAAALVTDPTVTVVIIATQGIAMAALIALQRLLGSDRESLK
jgi:hypothetical protein